MKPLRLSFFVLLLANVLFFAWQQNAGPANGHEPQRLQQELQPEKLKLIAAPAPTTTPTPPTAAAVAATVATAPEPAAPAAAAEPAPVPTPPVAVEPPPPPQLCKAFNGLTLEAAKEAQSEINTRSPNTKSSLQSVRENPSYWVFIPSQANKAGAEKKVGELKQLGIEESFIISDEGPNRWAISLGLFRNKDTAEAFLQNLSKKGVRSAKLDVREKGGDKTRLEIHAPAELLGTLAREIKPLAKASISDCKAP